MTPLDRAREIIELRAKATQGWLVADTNIYGTGKYVCCERGAIPIGDRVAEVLESHAGLDSNQAMANAIFFAHAANHAADVAQALIDAERRNAELGKTLHDLYPLWRLVWEQEISYREFECEHGFGPPASLCPNEKCIDRQVEAAIRVLEDTLNPQETHDDA
jgi:hypothetical protein